MKKILAILLLLFGFSALRSEAKQTFIYNIVGSDTLRLDLYETSGIDKPSPALIFAFGGGFVNGERDRSDYIGMFEFLAHNGISVVSIDYRTQLRHLTSADTGSMSRMVDCLTDAITCAVSDFLSATGYVLSNAASWNIDPSLIFASGSSAGAITALQAEYMLCNTPGGIGGFPADFNFAGVISFAGAIFSEGELEWTRTPAPMLLFHGDADSNVPYTDATINSDGLYGSGPISKSLADKGVKHWLHTFKGVDHAIAIRPIYRNRGEIFDFIRAVRNKELDDMRAVETVRTDGYKTTFTLQDFINSNYKH